MKSSITSRKQRFWALLLAVVMVVGLLPVANVEAAKTFRMDDTDVSAFVVGAIIEAGDTVTNNNDGSSSTHAVKIIYKDVNGNELDTQTIAANASATVPKYSDTLKTGVGALPTDRQSDKWVITSANKYDVGTAVGGCGDVSRITVQALPQYTITLNKKGGSNFDVSSLTAANIVTNDANKIVFKVNDGETIDLSKIVGENRGYDFAKWIIPDGTDPTGALLGAMFGPAPNPYQTIQFEQSTGFFKFDAANKPLQASSDTDGDDYNLTLEAKWTDKVYTITFNNNIPTGEDTDKATADLTGIPYFDPVTAGTYEVNLPSAPVKNDTTGSQYDHYTFDGWSVEVSPTPSTAPYKTSANMDDLLTDLGADKSTIPMIANWTAKNYTIKMDYDAPAAVSPVPANPADQTKPYGTGAGSAVSVAATMSVSTVSHTFAGWSFTKGATTADYTADTDIKTLVDAAEKAGVAFGSTSAVANLKDTLTLYGVWTENAKGTITFDGNGSDSGSVASQTDYIGANITIPANGFTRTGYTFKEWNTSKSGDGKGSNPGDAFAIGGDRTLYAIWTAIPTYTVTWNNYDGTALKTDTVYTGDVPAYTGTPTRAEDATNTYTFSGWSDGTTTYAVGAALPAVSANITYTAQYTAVKKTFTVTWNDYNGTALKTDTGVAAGTIPTYTGTPTRAADAANTYTFSGWNDGTTSYAVGAVLPAVSANVTYTAQYTATTNNYTITWKDGDGNTLGTSTVAYGAMPAYTLAATPTKKADATNTYSFNNNWSPVLTAVTGDATYTAQFTATPIATSPAPVSPAPVVITPAPVTTTPTPTVTPVPTEAVTPTPVEVKTKFYDIEYYEEIDGEEVRLKKTANPDTYEYGVGAEIKYGLDKEGYTFEGWYSKKSKKYVTKIGKKTKGTVKLYAIFTPDDEGSKDEGNNNSGQPASEFGVLCARLTDYTENSMTLTWNLLEDVDGYDIFGSRCNSKDVIRAYEPIDTVAADVNEYLADNLLAQTYYKFYVRAFILVNGEKRYITTSINVHGVTLNDTYGVADEINIDKVVLKYTNGKSKTKYNREKDGDVEEINITMKVGQTLTIVASESNADDKEIRAHRPISFESSKPEVCKIGKKSSHKYGVEVSGKANTYKSRTITAKAEGECTIYVFAQNGLYTKINVTVKK
ncbi:MAG: InlB B-repeat-containing protein [Lachnospiraceae bacterium]|nr:InlB B-repeat-containing protein [Lachnospiraceae bacterium]